MPKKSVAEWKKAIVSAQRNRLPEIPDALDGDEIFGGELTVEGVKTLKAALEHLDGMGLSITKKDVALWEKVGSGIRIQTKGALKRDATVRQLLGYFGKQHETGEEFVHVESDGKDGSVELWGYLAGYDAFSNHFVPLLLLGAAASDAEGTLVFVGDVELTDESVFVRVNFSKDQVELIQHVEPQDVTKEQMRELETGFGSRGFEHIRVEYAAWLERFLEKKRRRMFAGCVGWLRPDGSFAIEPRFRSAGGFSEGLAPVSEKGPFDYGYIDERGEWIIAPRFFSAGPFKHGRAFVKIEIERVAVNAYSSRIHYGCGFIDRKGAWCVEPQFDHAEDFAEERAIVGNAGLRGYIDLDGREIVKPKFRHALPFANGLALVAEHGKHETGGIGFLDKQGNVAIPLSLENAGPFHEGFAVAARNGLWGFLAPNGEFLFEPRFVQCGYLVRDRALAVVNGKWGVVDGKGATVIPFEHARLAEHGDFYVANTGQESIFFSRDGAELFRVPFTVLQEARDGRIAVATSYYGPFGYIDFGGRLVIEPRFTFAAPFSHGLAIVQDGESLKIIDHAGNTRHSFDFRLSPSAGAGHFSDSGIAYIESLNRFGLVNRDGKLLQPPEFEMIHGFGTDLIWAKYPTDSDA